MKCVFACANVCDKVCLFESNEFEYMYVYACLRESMCLFECAYVLECVYACVNV